MVIRSRVEESAAVTVAPSVAAVASTTALVESDTKLGIEFAHGDYQPTIGNVELAKPRDINDSNAELIEEFDGRIGAVGSLSFSRDECALCQT